MQRPAHIRSYDNVTLHASIGHRVGKEHLTKEAAQAWASLRSALEANVEPSDRVLVCCHKDVEPSVSLRGHSTHWATEHFGNLDGKNEWSDFGHQGARAAWSYFGAGQRAAFKQGFIAKSVVQAVNRIRCRKPVDAAGRSLSSKVFLLLGKGKSVGVILDAIQSQMPGIVVQWWDAGKTADQKRPRSEIGLLSFLRLAPAGSFLKSDIVTQLGITGRTFERLSPRLQQPSDPLAKALSSIGVEYRCSMGRGKEAHFIKT